jgi:CYTH domain-containing protein
LFRSLLLKDGLMEAELTDEAHAVNLPPFIEVLEDVTDDPAWTNWELSRIL